MFILSLSIAILTMGCQEVGPYMTELFGNKVMFEYELSLESGRLGQQGKWV